MTMKKRRHDMVARIVLYLMRLCDVRETDIDWSEFPLVKERIDSYRGDRDGA